MTCLHGKTKWCRPCEREGKQPSHPLVGSSDGTRLGDELAKLERENPDVAAAADRYHRIVERMGKR